MKKIELLAIAVLLVSALSLSCQKELLIWIFLSDSEKPTKTWLFSSDVTKTVSLGLISLGNSKCCLIFQTKKSLSWIENSCFGR